MKISTLLICLLLLCRQPSAKAQGLTPSTVRQVFSLQKGDSLEYYSYSETMAQGCGILCNVYRLNVIDSPYYNTTQDTLFIPFASQIAFTDTFAKPPSYGCGGCRSGFWVADYYSISSGLWVVANLDSSIKWAMDTIYGTVCNWSSDTSYIVPSHYNGSKQNDYGIGDCLMIDWDEIYADSLGIVYKTEQPGVQPDNTEQLIYYHKANGSVWGTYVYNGIKNVSDDYHLSVYPNPTEDKFVLHSDLYQGLRFEMYDMLSRQVSSIALTDKETQVDRNDLPSGIYYWEMRDGINVIKTGKLIME